MADVISKAQLEGASIDASDFQLFINGTDAQDVITRLGRTYPTLAKLAKLVSDSPVDALVGQTFKDVPAAQAAITAGTVPDGSILSVYDSENANILYLIYQNVSGTLTPVLDAEGNQKAYPSAAYFMAIAVLVNQTIIQTELPFGDKIPLQAYNFDKVLTWLDEGRFDSWKIGPSLMADIVVNLNGRILGAPFDLSDSNKIPLLGIFGELTKSIVFWIQSGFVFTTGMRFTSKEVLDPKKALQVSNAFTNKNKKFRWLSKLAKLDNGLNAVAKILFTGDSWSDFDTIPQKFADYLYSKYGKSSDGWANVRGSMDSSGRDYYLNTVDFTYSGFTLWAIGSPETTPPPFGTGLDGYTIYTTTTTGTATLSNVFATQINIYHINSGSYRYRVDGGSWVTVTTSNNTTTVKTSITGLTSDSSHTVEIDTTPNTSGQTVAIYGFDLDSSVKGVKLMKCGHAGARGLHYTYQIGPYINKYANDLNPDLIFVILGTNDYRTANSNIANFVAGIDTIVTAYKTAHPDAEIVYIAPPDTDGGQPVGKLRLFVDAALEYCVENNVGFLDLNAMLPTWAEANSLGLYLDSLHMNSTGAQFIVNVSKNEII